MYRFFWATMAGVLYYLYIFKKFSFLIPKPLELMLTEVLLTEVLLTKASCFIMRICTPDIIVPLYFYMKVYFTAYLLPNKTQKRISRKLNSSF